MYWKWQNYSCTFIFCSCIFFFVLTFAGHGKSWFVVTLYFWPLNVMAADRNPMQFNYFNHWAAFKLKLLILISKVSFDCYLHMHILWIMWAIKCQWESDFMDQAFSLCLFNKDNLHLKAAMTNHRKTTFTMQHCLVIITLGDFVALFYLWF